jgi:prepilin-type N-terminal cleavage/methylation domain-containing protein
MKRRDKGFTLIELMIVVAIIAIIAAIAIPSLLRSKMSANHSNAGAALKSLVTQEGIWRSQDIDQNGVADYWVADVAGFHGAKDAAGNFVKLIDVAFANADVNLNAAYNFTGQALATTPKQGYTYFGNLVVGNSQPPLVGGGHNLPASDLHTSAFAFCSVPATYNTDGVLTFLVAQDGVVWQLDRGNQANITSASPDIADPAGQAPPWGQFGS